MKTIRSIDFQAPIKTISEANEREHWTARHRRKKAQQQLMAAFMFNALRGRRIKLPCRVRLTRIGPRSLDSDNLAASMKHVQDAIASRLGIDDGDADQVTWEYSQMPVRVKEYGVKVSISSI